MEAGTPSGGTVLLTGASGTIGTALRDRLPALGWDLRSVDVAPADGVERVDVTVAGELDPVMAGSDAVIHLAGIPTEAPWPAIRDANIDGTFEVFDAARRHGVRRVVHASSNHAAGFTALPTVGSSSPGPEMPSPALKTSALPADTPARPDTLYGVSKVFGEALARYFVDRYAMQIACLRIGTFSARPPDQRALRTWLSPDDCSRLVDACLRTESLEYALIWGVSANSRRLWSLDAGYAVGYFPVDDAEQFATELADAEPLPSDAFLGGGFTTTDFGIDEVKARTERS